MRWRQWSRSTKISVAIGVLPLVFWIGFQIFQEVVTWVYPPCIVQGIVVDEQGLPVSGARLVFQASEFRMWLPIIYSPAYRVHAVHTVTTDHNGQFEVKWRRSDLKLISLGKKGYVTLDKPRRTFWQWGLTPETYGPYTYKIKYIMHKTL